MRLEGELQSCKERLGLADEQRDELSARHEAELQQMRQVRRRAASPCGGHIANSAALLTHSLTPDFWRTPWPQQNALAEEKFNEQLLRLHSSKMQQQH